MSVVTMSHAEIRDHIKGVRRARTGAVHKEIHCEMIEGLLERIIALESPAVGVEGVYMDRSIAQFIRAVEVLLKEERDKPNPNNALIAVLCDAVRVTRELTLVAQRLL